jgi:hypothetical protein
MSTLFASQSAEVRHFKKKPDHPLIRLVESKFSNPGRDLTG